MGPERVRKTEPGPQKASSKRPPAEKGVPMSEKPRRRSSTDVLKSEVKQLDERLAHLESLLEEVRAQAKRQSGPARERLERVDKVLRARIRTTQSTLKASLDRMGQTVADSRKTVEEEISRVTRGLLAGVKAGRAALRKP
jgi:DNA repair exonuclease SbcCD ATPase subunit